MSVKLMPEILERDVYLDRERQSDILIDLPSLRVHRIQGKLERPWTTALRIRSNHFAVKFNLKGAVLVHDLEASSQHVAPAQSVIFARGPIEIPVDFARGMYDHYVFTWHMNQAVALSRWVESWRLSQNKKSNSLVHVSSGLALQIVRIQERMLRASHSFGEVAEPLVFGSLHELIVYTLTSKDEINLTSLPSDVPDFLRNLLASVKTSPERPWSLKDASALAGYSPFHLSRTFKASMGYGFPAYVDRCRVEKAIQHLSLGDHSIDKVAAMCGYSSTHGLREAMKEYIGFLPSELRSYALMYKVQDQHAA